MDHPYTGGDQRGVSKFSLNYIGPELCACWPRNFVLPSGVRPLIDWGKLKLLAGVSESAGARLGRNAPCEEFEPLMLLRSIVVARCC